MQRVLRFLAIYSKLKNKRDIAKKTKKYRGGEFQSEMPDGLGWYG
jgi:hypothetical protein